jgi:hypothetical protein
MENWFITRANSTQLFLDSENIDNSNEVGFQVLTAMSTKMQSSGL